MQRQRDRNMGRRVSSKAVLLAAAPADPSLLGSLGGSTGALLALSLLFLGALLFFQKRYLPGSLLIGLAVGLCVAQAVWLR
ncbi:MAG TPA: hypothetical protein VFB21_00550 [Chthonomonadaceae bacterium]|nr:hypothetical protein [Chthonomonadaceae bacterium]